MNRMLLLIAMITVVQSVVQSARNDSDPTFLDHYYYCHFRSLDQFSDRIDLDLDRDVEIMSCGKCYLNSYSSSDNAYDYDLSSGNETTTTNLTTSRQHAINQNHKYCLYYDEAMRLNGSARLDLVDDNIASNLTSDWFTIDLLRLIQAKLVLTNLEMATNESQLERLLGELRIVELVDLGIERVDKSTFRQFNRLKVLRLANNRLKSVELSSFITVDEMIPTSSHLTQSELRDGDEERRERRQVRRRSGSKYETNFIKRLIKFAHKAFKFQADDTFRSSTNQMQSHLVELDLSFNQITSVRLENFMYLDNLRILNLTHNNLKYFDLRFISIVSPKLQILDLSFNRLRRIKLVENFIYSHHHHIDSNRSSSSSSLNLISNMILNDLVYLNLNENELSNFGELFSIESQLISNKYFCQLPRSSPTQLNTSVLTSDETRSNETNDSSSFISSAFNNSTLNDTDSKVIRRSKSTPFRINLRANKWKCDCQSFDLITALLSMATKLSYVTIGKQQVDSSCYLRSFFKQNSFILKSLLSEESFELVNELNCTKSSHLELNWLDWYKKNCLFRPTSSSTVSIKLVTLQFATNQLFDTKQSNNATIKTTTTTTTAMTTMTTTTTTTTSRSLFFSNLNFTYGYNSRPPILKYDVTGAFFWVSSICVLIVMLSCLLIAWFYCWKKYHVSRRVHLNGPYRSNANRSHQRHLSHQMANGSRLHRLNNNSRHHQASQPANNGRNIYILGSSASLTSSFNNRAFLNERSMIAANTTTTNNSNIQRPPATNSEIHSLAAPVVADNREQQALPLIGPLYRHLSNYWRNSTLFSQQRQPQVTMRNETTADIGDLYFMSQINRNPLYLENNSSSSRNSMLSQSQIESNNNNNNNNQHQHHHLIVDQTATNQLLIQAAALNVNLSTASDDEPPNYYEAIIAKHVRLNSNFLLKNYNANTLQLAALALAQQQQQQQHQQQQQRQTVLTTFQSPSTSNNQSTRTTSDYDNRNAVHSNEYDLEEREYEENDTILTTTIDFDSTQLQNQSTSDSTDINYSSIRADDSSTIRGNDDERGGEEEEERTLEIRTTGLRPRARLNIRLANNNDNNNDNEASIYSDADSNRDDSNLRQSTEV